jgi:AcrR family transcriptional regulator
MAKAADAPPRSLREARKELTRETLLSAAQAAFEEDGYVQVTVDDIVQRAGAGRGTFYLYFESKAKALEAVIEKTGLRQHYRALLVRLAAMEAPSLEALEAWIDDYIDLYLAHRSLHRSLQEARAVEPQFTDDVVASLVEQMGLSPLTGFAPDGDVEVMQIKALMSFVMIEGVLYLWLVQGVPLDRSKTTRVLAEQLFAAIHPS